MRSTWPTVFAAVAVAIGASSASGAATPVLSVSAQTVEPSAAVDVRGTGFPASEGLVLALDGTAIAQTSTDAYGAFNGSVVIPAAAAAGQHVLSAAAASGTAADITLTVVSSAPHVVDAVLPSRGIGGPLRMAIYLPAGYATGAKRYPVIYFLHGLPATDSSYRAWASFVMQGMSGFPDAAIVVIPQAARASDIDPEFQDWGEAREWETAIAVELPAWVDAHYRTIAARRGRALVGVSAGGYGAVIVGLHHLRTFSVLESWSGYFAPTDPEGTARLDLGSPERNARAAAETFIPSLRARGGNRPTFLGFYVGRGDARFRAENVRFHQRLLAASVPHAFGVYPGGHTTALWANEAPFWLGLALSHLAR